MPFTLVRLQEANYQDCNTLFFGKVIYRLKASGSLFSHYASLEDDWYFLQQFFRKANSYISIYKLRFSYGQTVNQATCQNFEIQISSTSQVTTVR